MVTQEVNDEASYTIEVIPGTGIALFHWVGPITLDDRFNNLELMSKFCASNNVRDLIIDGRDQESRTSVSDGYDFGSRVPEAFRGLRVAVVHRPDDESLRFIETVAFNRGSQTRAFMDVGAARAWLDAQDHS